VIALVETADVRCGHQRGKVGLTGSQSLVRIDDVVVLVRPDPERRPIRGCPNVSAMTKACQTTLQVHVGYSTLVRIDGEPIVLDNLAGVTDGMPPAGATYKCIDPAQRLVSASA